MRFPAVPYGSSLVASLGRACLLLVLDRVFANDAEGFNQALAQALQQHHYHYAEALNADGEDQIYVAEGWASLLLSAACVLAEQRGLSRTVTSDYMPEWLIKGEFDTRQPPRLEDLMYNLGEAEN